MSNADTAPATDTYTFSYPDYPGYICKAVGRANVYDVTMHAPNGTQSGVLPTVKAAENWMVSHFNAGSGFRL